MAGAAPSVCPSCLGRDTLATTFGEKHRYGERISGRHRAEACAPLRGCAKQRVLMYACMCLHVSAGARAVWEPAGVCAQMPCVCCPSACSLVRDGWVWVPLTEPGPALFWGYWLHAPLRENPPSHRAITSGSFIAHLLFFFEESWLESGQGEILLKSLPLSTNFLFNSLETDLGSHLLFLLSLAISECLCIEVYVSWGKSRSRKGGAVCGTSPGPKAPGDSGVGNLAYLQTSLSFAPLASPNHRSRNKPSTGPVPAPQRPRLFSAPP